MIQTLDCYYCNDEEGYFCPQPFPSKFMFKNEEKYREQMKNIPICSNEPSPTETLVRCFVRKRFVLINNMCNDHFLENGLF